MSEENKKAAEDAAEKKVTEAVENTAEATETKVTQEVEKSS